MGRKKLKDTTFFVTKRVGRATHEFTLLPDGCTALVGLSGGYASVALLRALLAREQRVPTTATFVPVYVPDRVHGDDGTTVAMLDELCRGWGLELVVTPPLPSAGHFRSVPYAAVWRIQAIRHAASVVVLGHTILDFSMAVALPMLKAGKRARMEVKEPLPGAPGVQVVRPLCHLTHEAVMRMVEGEELPYRKRVIPHPDQAVQTLLLEHMAAKKGSIMEMLRNLSQAPDNIQDEYLA